MANIEKNHESAGGRERKSRSQYSWPEDTGVHPERHHARACDDERYIAADETDSVADNCISRTGRFGERRKEKEIRGGSERWKHKWIAAHERQQSKHSDGDESIHKHVDGPHESRREVMEQPM